MAEATYCPKCDCLVQQHSGKCFVCESRTISLFMNTEKNSWLLLMAIMVGMIFFVIFLAMDIMGSIGMTVVVSTAMISVVLFGSVYVMWKNHKPIIDGALERGRQLYTDNKEKYENGETIKDTDLPPPPTQFPWGIRNVNKLRIALVVFIVLTPMGFLSSFLLEPWLSRSSSSLTGAFLTTSFMVVAMFIHIIYAPAKRHNNLIQALKLSPQEIKLDFKSLKIDSKFHGKFEMNYDRDRGYQLLMDIEIDADKKISDETLWARPGFFSKKRFPASNDNSKYLPMSPHQLGNIKSLKKIQIENHYYGKKLIALFEDKKLYSETNDLVRVIRLLAEIKKMIEEDYSAVPDKGDGIPSK